jgi:uroporphyrin-3 C-methyltransferase
MDEKQLNQDIDELAHDPVDRLMQDKKPVSSGKPVAILALLVALASVSATGWQWWQTRQADPDEVGLQDTLAQLRGAQQQLSQSVTAIEGQLNSIEKPIDAEQFSRQVNQLKALQNQVATLQGQTGEDEASISSVQGSVRSLEQRLSATESGLITVAASSQNSSVALNIAEIDFLLRTASERLSLFSDPAAADLALLAADVQLEALNDPMFLSVRQRIAVARQNLASIPDVDRVQLTSKLSDMQSRIPGLPFRGEVEEQPQTELAEDAGWWESFKQTMSSLVTVRRRAPEDQSLLSLEDKDYLRQGLWLQLETARLALMRNDTDAWNRSLGRVDDTLKQFFRDGGSNVQAFLLDSTGLKQVEIAPQMPDISAPWMQLRQLRDSRRLLQSSTPVEPEAANSEPLEDAPVDGEDPGQ